MLSIPNKPIMLILNLLSVAYAECHRQTHYYECPYVPNKPIMLSVIMLSVTMLSVANSYCPKQTHYAECPYAECH
jgi:hypothetical protein